MSSPFSGSAQRNNDLFLSNLASQNAGSILTGLANAQERGLGLINQGQTNAIGALDAAQPLSLAALQGGFNQARGAYGDASALYQPYATTGQNAFNLYADANGVNGGAGAERAQGSFRASPGYQWAVDQATDATARKAGALGMAGSGNTLAAISDRAGHMADQEYGNWLSRVNGIGQTGYNATNAQAGLQRGIGDLYSQQGTGEAGIYSGDARAKANIYDSTGRAGAQMVGNTASQMANAYGNMTNQITNLGMDAGKAGQTAGANNFAALMGGANLALGGLGALTGGMGGMGGLTGGLGKINDLFGGSAFFGTKPTDAWFA